MNTAEQRATALRVLATAVSRGLVTDRPESVDVRAHGLKEGLEPAEVRWLFLGLCDARIEMLPATTTRYLEDVQICGLLLGWPVRILLVGRQFAGLLGDLSMELANHAIEARALALTP